MPPAAIDGDARRVFMNARRIIIYETNCYRMGMVLDLFEKDVVPRGQAGKS